MISAEFWQLSEIDRYGLWVTRLLLVVYFSVSVALYVTRLRHRSRFLAIPKPIRIFTGTWLVYWGSFATFIFFAGGPQRDEWFITLYGMGYLGSLWGLFWCLLYVTKTPQLPDHALDIYRKVIVDDVHEKINQERDR